jgi:apolipoprotein N-acyltransferase
VLLAGASLASAAALAACGLMQRPWFALSFVALVPWLAALAGARSVAGALGVALVFSLAFTACVFAWFADAIVAYTGAPLALAWLVLLGLAPVLEPQLFVFAAVRRLAGASATAGCCPRRGCGRRGISRASEGSRSWCCS